MEKIYRRRHYEGIHPDAPHDREILTKNIEELNRLEDGNGNIPVWTNRADCIRGTLKEIAILAQSLSEHVNDDC